MQDENDLILHQKNKHWKCLQCGKRLVSAKALSIHSLQVHKVTVRYIPDAKEGRDDPSWEIFGSQGIPAGMQRGQDPPQQGAIVTPGGGTLPHARGMPSTYPPGAMPPHPYGSAPPYYPQHHRPTPPMPNFHGGGRPHSMGPPLPGERGPPLPPFSTGPPRPYLPPGPPPPHGYGRPPPPHMLPPHLHRQFPHPLYPPPPMMGHGPPPRPGYPHPVIANGIQQHSYPPPGGLPPHPVLPPPAGPPPTENEGTAAPPREAEVALAPSALPHCGSGTELIWAEEELSMEERRASLPKYNHSPAKNVPGDTSS
ncbi:hypothetical protein KSW81_005193 [Nannochloris sp. 'desiccata']|nr:hypothetical protein KSW81_005193 [Chlorella desiccata (nom. nud.)]